MLIVNERPDENGRHDLVETDLRFDGWLPFDLDMTDFYTYNGFVSLTVEDGVVTGYEPNVEAWEQWQAEHPVPEPQPTAEEDRDAMLVDLEYRLTLLELGVN